MNNRFELIKLDPEIILHKSEIELVNGHRELKFVLDFKKGNLDERTVIIETQESSETALLRQLILTLRDISKENKEEFNLGEDSLKYYMVFLDFEKLFKYKKVLKEPFDFSQFEKKVKAGLSDDEIEKIQYGNEYINEALYFLFEKGFYIEIDKETIRHFVPFESSASMSRNSRVSFIDQSIKNRLDNRLMLGMDFTFGSDNKADYVAVPAHKYFAYRGLYLTDGTRIEKNEKIELNEETVIVIADSNHDINNEAPTITAEINPHNKDYWDIFNDEKIISLNAFDGEGLICPEYAKEINLQLFNDEEGASSFQIRMPFIKGMLHCVDYHKFYREEVGIDYSTPCIVKDIYGKDRDITKVKIILTKSMLKNNGWIKEYIEKRNKKNSSNMIDDPMKFLFDRMKEYDHSLYIAKTNANLHNEDKEIKLNYQCLNTLKMSDNDFEKIVKKYIDNIRQIEKNPDSQREFLLGERETTNCAWRYAISRNINFLDEKYIKTQIRKEIDSRIKDIYRGNIRVPGENRFLSGDLLALMIHIIAQFINIDVDDKKRKELFSHCIKANEFRMPNPNIKIKHGKTYGFLRNPHLSRNEECVLNYAESDKYDSYFENLSGVIMIGYDSLSPMTLGGADFDGDMVKLIADSDVIKAMREGKKECKELVDIPSYPEKPSPVPKKMTFPYVKDTFGNQIGQISNMAIILGEELYFRSDKEQNKKENNKSGGKHQYIPADCTLLTGLEIDAAKTGNHPKGNIAEVKGQIEEDGDNTQYLAVREDLDKINNSNVYYIYRNDTKKSFSLDCSDYEIVYDKRSNIKKKKNNNDEEKEEKREKIVFSKKVNCKANIERLPSYYMEVMYSNRGKLDRVEDNDSELFLLENEKSFSSDDQKTYDEARAIIDVYYMYCRRLRAMRSNFEKSKESNWYGKAKLIFKKQYCGQSDYQEKENYFDIVYMKIEKFILETNNHSEYGDTFIRRADTIIQKLKEEDWIFTKAEDRCKKIFNIIPSTVFDVESIDNIDDEIIKQLSILTNFSENGYMLIYYIVNDIKKCHSDLEDIEVNRPIQEKVVSDKSEHYIEMHKKAFEKSKALYFKAINRKYTYGKFEKDLMKCICENLIENNLNKYGMFFYYCSAPFFWKMFGEKERLNKLKESEIIVDYLPYKKWTIDNRKPDVEIVEDEDAFYIAEEETEDEAE